MTRARTLADLGSQSLATDAEATAAAQAAAAAVPTGRKNLLYNGAMQVAQRGTSSTGITGDGYYTADRWDINISGLGTWTQSIESDGPTGSGLVKSLKMLCTTADAAPAAADLMQILTRLEGQDLQRIAKGTSSAQQLTLSFWVKSNVTGTYIAELVDSDNSRQVSASYSVSASATWEKKTITFPADTIGTFNNDNQYSLACVFWLGAGSDRTSGTLNTAWASTVNANRAVGQTNLAAATNNYWQITGVQLEVGDTATDFEHKPYGVELAECQRYYYKIKPGVSDPSYGFAYNRNTTLAQAYVAFPNTMRIAPTALETTGTASDYQIIYLTTSQTCNGVPFFGATSDHGFDLYFEVASGLTAGQGSKIASKSVNSYLAWSAEL